MKAKDLRELSPEELRQRYDEIVKEDFNLRLQKSSTQLEKPSRLRELRRDRARVLTVMNEQKESRGA